MYLYFILSALFNAIASTVLGITVYTKNRNSRINRYFALLCFGFALWSYPYSLWPLADNKEGVKFWFQVLHFGAIYIPIAYFHFVVVWFNKDKNRMIRLQLVLGYISAIVFSFFVFSPLFIADMEPKFAIKWWAIPGMMYYVYLTYFFFFYVYASVLLFLEYFKLKSTDIKKKQVKFLLVGLVIAIAGGSTNYFLWFDINIPPYGNILASTHVILGAYAISRYKFLNIRTVVAQIAVLTLNVLAFSDIFIAASTEERIIKIILFLGVVFVSFLLFKSFNREIKRKEELERLTKKLAKSNNKLKELDRAKNEFISITAHQLRTPPTVIKGYITLAQEDPNNILDEDTKESLNRALISNERLIDLVEDILNVSRMESGSMKYEMRENQLCTDVLSELYDAFVLKAKDKDIKFILNKPKKPLPKMVMDSRRIKEVVSNLVDNAIKYTQKGSVEIGARKVDDKIRIEVKDSGVGITKEDMPELFKKFSRGKNPDRLGAEGTGLGIFVGKKIIEDHGGKIWAESSGADKGSTFIIEIPIKLKEADNKSKKK